jgi:hypothetical protein
MFANLDRGPLPGRDSTGGVVAGGTIDGTPDVDAGAGAAVICGAVTVTVLVSAG